MDVKAIIPYWTPTSCKNPTTWPHSSAWQLVCHVSQIIPHDSWFMYAIPNKLFLSMTAGISHRFYPLAWQLVCHASHILLCGSWYMVYVIPRKVFFHMAAGISCCLYPYACQLVCHTAWPLIHGSWYFISQILLHGSCYMYAIPLYSLHVHGSWYVIPLISFFWMTAAMS